MRRYLIVANQTLAAEPLSRGCVSSPAPLRAASTSWSPRRRRATTSGPKARLGRPPARAWTRPWPGSAELGAEVEGEVGDGNPMLAIGDALRDHGPFDEIVISTLPKGLSKWLKVDLPHRAEASFGLRVTHVVEEPARPTSGRRAS